MDFLAHSGGLAILIKYFFISYLNSLLSYLSIDIFLSIHTLETTQMSSTGEWLNCAQDNGILMNNKEHSTDTYNNLSKS